ncbi:hypothetical protein BGX30_005636, partial [Mortierella sp. GBA39]
RQEAIRHKKRLQLANLWRQRDALFSRPTCPKYILVPATGVEVEHKTLDFADNWVAVLQIYASPLNIEHDGAIQAHGYVLLPCTQGLTRRGRFKSKYCYLRSPDIVNLDPK